MQLDAKTTALVLIDLQKGVLARPVVPHPATSVFERSKRLAPRFRTARSPVVWVRVSFARDFADAPRAKVDEPSNFGALPPGWDEFPEPLHPADVMVTKRQWGAFYGTDLDLQLRRRGVRTIVLGGIATSIGVESTARSAWEHGYELVICEDLCADLSAETHAFSFKHIFPRLARIASSEAITLE
ncbi:MAG: hydrolase [Steroidobacteraceae bacterium]